MILLDGGSVYVTTLQNCWQIAQVARLMKDVNTPAKVMRHVRGEGDEAVAKFWHPDAALGIDTCSAGLITPSGIKTHFCVNADHNMVFKDNRVLQIHRYGDVLGWLTDKDFKLPASPQLPGPVAE